MNHLFITGYYWLLKPVGRLETYFPSRKLFSAILCSSFKEETLSSSDITNASAAYPLTYLGQVVVSKQLPLNVATPKTPPVAASNSSFVGH